MGARISAIASDWLGLYWASKCNSLTKQYGYAAIMIASYIYIIICYRQLQFRSRL